MDLDFVSNRVAIGGAITSLYDARKIAAAGITRVVNLRQEQDEIVWVQQAGMVYYPNPTSDDKTHKPAAWFMASFDCFIRTLKEPGEKILFHCHEGLNRSPSTLYFLLQTLGCDRKGALEQILYWRPQAEGHMSYNADADRALKELGFVGKGPKPQVNVLPGFSKVY